ncbi:6-phosphogluconolactonase [Thiohalorhabdus sp.]|uniref:6-phosphogluconolactonase n=1 Tax=Thiohalorhabdus sp. TaxID=3094134 RepID=UPI002FC36D15
MDRPSPEISVAEDRQSLYRAVAERLTAAARGDAAGRGAFHWALAGGSTPEGLYRLLAGPDFARRIPWPQVHAWFGDERCVPPGHPDSNYRMARSALLDHVAVGRVYRMAGEAEPREAAAAYARQLREALPAPEGVPVLDLVVLGLGPDGHVASLFPDTDALVSEAPVAAAYVPRLAAWRLSLTVPVINSARRVWLLASGPDKAAVVATALAEPGAQPLPVQRLAPRGEWLWFLDAAAAAELPRP